MDLTELVRDRLANHGISHSDTFAIRGRAGEGTYSVAYDTVLNGAPLLFRLFKKTDEDDQMDRKWQNIQAEIDTLDKLKQAGVTQRMLELKVPLREIHHTSNLFPENPIVYQEGQTPYTFVGFQFCDLIPGQTLGGMQAERADPQFVRALGRHFGTVLAEFHWAAREVEFPRYDTPEDLSARDHAYRMVRNAFANTQQGKNPVHHELAHQLREECFPLFDTVENRTIRIHGDLGVNNILVLGPGDILMLGPKVSGIVDWDKARQGHAEYDFLGASITPGMLRAAVPAYESRMTKLSGGAANINRPLILKFALAQQTAMANSRDTKVIDASTVGMGILLEQLARIDPTYRGYEKAVRPQVRALERQRPGIRYEVRT